MATLTETIRRAIDDSGQTLYRIAKDSGVSHTIIHGFYHDCRGMKLATADRLATYLGLELRPVRKRKG